MAGIFLLRMLIMAGTVRLAVNLFDVWGDLLWSVSVHLQMSPAGVLLLFQEVQCIEACIISID